MRPYPTTWPDDYLDAKLKYFKMYESEIKDLVGKINGCSLKEEDKKEIKKILIKELSKHI